MNVKHAPGKPGVPARWTSSAKSGVGTALRSDAKVWFTLSHGILNEVYYPRIDHACTRDLGLIVTDGKKLFSEEKRDASHEISLAADGVPAFHLRNTCKDGRYRIEKDVIADPARAVILQRVRFTPLRGALTDYQLFALLAPHLGNAGDGNTAWVGEYKGTLMLLAERAGHALAFACSTPWLRRSVGFVGTSDGWRDLKRHKRLAWSYEEAKRGNVAATGEIDLAACGGEFVLSLGFGRTWTEAAHRCGASLWQGYDDAAGQYLRDWSAWQKTLLPLDEVPRRGRDLYRISASVLRAHESAHFPGGIVASLAIPWGSSKGDGDLGGYHLTWARDLAESGGALLAAGAMDEARRVLRYLAVTQEAAGHWPQNFWLDGSAYLKGLQLDEVGLPVLLVELARREGALDDALLARLWPMVRKAASFLVQNGPVTPQDRWEEDPGYSPFTLAVEIAALLAAAELAERAKEPHAAGYLRATADAWNDSVERWTFARGTRLARRFGVDGYYVRITPPSLDHKAPHLTGVVRIKNRKAGGDPEEAKKIVSPDALALVRFGLRAADDPRIASTVKVIDGMLKGETPAGPSWHRYNDDGYGEHKGGKPFDGNGIGRLWPLLTGERAHYALAAGRREEAEALTATMAGFANEGGILPEQVWDAADVPKRELFRGKATGSAMPLVWAHAEYLKLCRSLRDGRVFDMPEHPVRRYQVDKVVSPRRLWRFNHKPRTIAAGQLLRVETQAPATVRWSADNWATFHDTDTEDSSLGMHFVDLPTAQLEVGAAISFTFRWAHRWEGKKFRVVIEDVS